MQSMNGKMCRVVGPLNEKEQRYPVFVYDTKEVVLIKPSNLMLAPDAAVNRRIRTSAADDDFKDMHSANWMRRGVEYKLKDNATILYYKTFLTEQSAQALLQKLRRRLRWQQTGRMPRLQSWIGDEGITNKMASLTQTQRGHSWAESRAMLHIKNTIEQLLQCRFHYVLINQYRDKNDSIAWHVDDEAIPRCKNIVASVSLGGPRTFLFRHKNWKTNALKKEFTLTSGCLLVMKDDTQRSWQHSVPKSKKRVNPRINLTFRQVCRGCRLCSRKR